MKWLFRVWGLSSSTRGQGSSYGLHNDLHVPRALLSRRGIHQQTAWVGRQRCRVPGRTGALDGPHGSTVRKRRGGQQQLRTQAVHLPSAAGWLRVQHGVSHHHQSACCGFLSAGICNSESFHARPRTVGIRAAERTSAVTAPPAECLRFLREPSGVAGLREWPQVGAAEDAAAFRGRQAG